MVAGVTGTVQEKTERYAVLATVSGIAVKVYCPAITLKELHPGTPISLRTHLVVAEDKLDLYGFTDTTAIQLFEQLISVSGVGPRSALAIMDIGEVKTIVSAIAAGRSDLISAAPGIGTKTAQKIIVDLKTKVLTITSADAVLTGSEDEEVVEALVGLGYQKSQVKPVVVSVEKTLSIDEKIKAALKILGRQKQ